MIIASLPAQSDGPDRFNTSPTCHEHQNFVRTGQRDYMCCCNPCAYGTLGDISDNARHCCRCNPILVIFAYEPDDPEAECCYAERVPVFGRRAYDDSSNAYVEYTVFIVGHTVTLAISTGPVIGASVGNPAYSADKCYWTLSAPSLGVLELIEIDHTNVTCLGVPSFSINGVITRETCSGSIVADNFAAAKVPFVPRYFEERPYQDEGLTLPMPGSYCTNCLEVARFLCLYGSLHDGFQPELAEMEWDYAPENIQGTTPHGFIVGRWLEKLPHVEGAFKRKIYLIEVDEGSETVCKMFFDFEPGDLYQQSDTEAHAIAERAAELFAPITLPAPNGAGCGINHLVGPIDNLVNAGFRVTTGRCGCWRYHCGTCRCLPAYLCGFVFIDETFYQGVRFQWVASIHGWVSISGTGVDIDDNVLAETISLLIVDDGYGECQVVWTKAGYDITPHGFECNLAVAMSFSGLNTAKTQYAFVSVHSAFGQCDKRLKCSLASPCDAECGGHAKIVMLTAHGYNDPYEDEPGIIGECLLEIPLFLVSTFTLLPGVEGDAPLFEFTCKYFGMYLFDHGGNTYRMEVESKEGVITFTQWNQTLGGPGHSWQYIFDYETCNPYHATFFERFALTSCPWATDQTIQRIQIDLVEVV